MSEQSLTVKEKQTQLLGVLQSLAENPILTGLSALALNQLAYKGGLWDARPSADGKVRTLRRAWGIGTDGGFHIDVGTPSWVVVDDPEEIAATNATIIGDMIIAATIAFAAAPKHAKLGLV